jgi:O-antigen/teichoic acid export membrane protein
MSRVQRLAGSDRDPRLLPTWTRDWAGDSSFLVASQVVTALITSALAILIARQLAPSDWGTFSALFGLGLAMSVVVDFGLGTWLLRELSQIWASGQTRIEARDRVGLLSTCAVVINGTVGAFTVLVVVAVCGVQGKLMLALVAGSLVGYGALLATANGLDAYLRSQRRLRRLVTFTVTEKCVLLTLVVVLSVVLDLGLVAIAAAYTVAGTLRLALVGGTVFWKDSIPLTRPTVAALRDLIAGVLPIALNTGALNVAPRLVSLMLLTISATSAGFFAIGERVLGPAMLVPVALSTTLYPFLSRELRPGRMVVKFSALLASLGLILAVVGAALAPSLVPRVFGSQYHGAIGPVQVMLFVLPLTYASNPLLAHLYLQGRERFVLRVTLIATAVGAASILTGQLLSGPALAAAGFVFWQLLVLSALLGVELSSRRSDSRASAEPLSAPPHVVAAGDPLE